MAANPHRLYMTAEQYVAFDRASEIKYEYLDGEAVAMAGGSINHNRLTGNMFYFLTQELGLKGPCLVYNSDTRVLVAKKQYVYPDVTVSCDVADHQGENDILYSPHIVVEVISPGTEATDRGKKLNWYRSHPTIQEYIIVNTRVQLVEIYRRNQDSSFWTYHTYNPGDTIEITSLDIQIALDELYAGIRIPLPTEDSNE